MRRPVTIARLLVMPLVLLGFAGAGEAQLVLYDDFNKKPINPAKWSGSESNAGPAAPNTEAGRKLVGKKLSISLTTWGRTDSNTGSAGFLSNRLGFTNPALVTTIQADVTVKSTKIVGCAANATSTAATAEIHGSFFNDGTSSGSGDRTGDIIAGIVSQRDSLAGDQILAFVYRCTNATCTTFLGLHPQIVFAASWVPNVAITMRLQWDQPNKQFIYTLNPGGGQEQHVLTYGLSDTNAPVVTFKHLAANNSAASCMGPAPRAYAIMQTLFDNVMVNP